MTVPRNRLAGLLLFVFIVVVIADVVIRYADSSPRRTFVGGGSAYGDRPVGASALRDLPPAPVSARAARSPREPGVTVGRGVAQLFVVGFSGDTPGAPLFQVLRRRAWGGVLIGRANVASAGALPPLAGEIGVVAREARIPVPLVVGDVDLPGLPDVGVLGARDVRRLTLLASRALRGAGVSAVLAPSADIGYEGGPYAQRASSDDPIEVARSARAAVSGWRGGGVAPVVAAYPGTGAASGDPAAGVATVGLSLPELREADLRVFGALRARAPVIQMSGALYAAFDGVTPATLLPEAVTMLRRDGFRGVVMSANLPATTLATGGSVAESAVAALRAGCDLLLISGDAGDQEAAYRAVLRAVKSGEIAPARYQDALARVAALKRAYRVR